MYFHFFIVRNSLLLSTSNTSVIWSGFFLQHTEPFLYSSQVILNLGQFCLSGDILQLLEIFLVVTTRGGEYYWHLASCLPKKKVLLPNIQRLVSVLAIKLPLLLPAFGFSNSILHLSVDLPAYLWG